MKRFATLFLSAAMLLSLILTGCGRQNVSETSATVPDGVTAETNAPAPATQERVIRVAMIAPMTGDNAQNGERMKRGAELCIEDYESAGKLGGAKIVMDVYDDKNDPKEAVNIANKILAEGDYAFVYGPFASGNGLAIAEVLDEEGIVVISPTVSHASFIADYDYTFRVGQLNYFEGIYIARYCAQKWGSEKIAGIYTNNDWGVTMSGPFAEECKNQGLDIVANEAYMVGQTKDFSSILTSIKNSGADTIYIMAQYEDTGKILSQIYQMGYDFKIAVSSSSYMPETLEIAGAEAVAGDNIKFFSTFCIDNPDPVISEFRARVQKVYGTDIDQPTVRAYDAMNVALGAIDRLGPDAEITGDALKTEIMNVRDYSGPSGPFTIKDDRNIERTFFVSVPDGNGGFRFAESEALSG